MGRGALPDVSAETPSMRTAYVELSYQLEQAVVGNIDLCGEQSDLLPQPHIVALKPGGNRNWQSVWSSGLLTASRKPGDQGLDDRNRKTCHDNAEHHV
jgi:hypothetical protein